MIAASLLGIPGRWTFQPGELGTIQAVRRTSPTGLHVVVANSLGELLRKLAAIEAAGE